MRCHDQCVLWARVEALRKCWLSQRHRDGDSEPGLCPVPDKEDPTVACLLPTHALEGSWSESKVERLDSVIPTLGWTLKEAPERHQQVIWSMSREAGVPKDEKFPSITPPTHTCTWK